MKNARDIDIIMQDFYKMMKSKRGIEKSAGEIEAPAESHQEEVNPEDFLLEEEEHYLSSTDQLDKAIDKLDNKADDVSCAVCGSKDENHVHDELDSTEESGDHVELEKEWSELVGLTDINKNIDNKIAQNYLIDSHASEVLYSLGKIASSLRQKNESFAADVVEATAFSIRDDLIKEASEKLHAITSLEKIASELKDENPNDFSIDLIQASINRIKNVDKN